jgi:hypothetical protein
MSCYIVHLGIENQQTNVNRILHINNITGKKSIVVYLANSGFISQLFLFFDQIFGFIF